MEIPHGPTPPCESCESDGPSKPMELDEPNRFEFEADAPQAGELEENNPFDGLRIVFETGADDSVPSSDLVPEIRPRQRDVYSAKINRFIYTS